MCNDSIDIVGIAAYQLCALASYYEEWLRVDLSKIIFFFAVASTLQIAIDELDLRGYM